jgi:hypothetical protein
MAKDLEMRLARALATGDRADARRTKMLDKRLKDLIRNVTRAEQEERRAMARPVLAVGPVIDLCQESYCMEGRRPR